MTRTAGFLSPPWSKLAKRLPGRFTAFVSCPIISTRTKFAYEQAGGVITLREVKVEDRPHARLERQKGRTVVASNRVVTSEDVARAMESFP